MMKYAAGVEIHIEHVEAAIIDLSTCLVVPGTVCRTSVSAQESAQKLFDCWTETIKKSLELSPEQVSHIGIAVPGPFDYEKGIFLIQNLQKFDAVYGMNLKEILGERLQIPADNIRTANNSPCFLKGEVLHGAAKGYENVLGFILSTGFGSARYFNGEASDADLWKAPFKNSNADTFFNIKWLAQRYEEFTGIRPSSISELTTLTETDDGIGGLVFGEYGENFGVFLSEYVKLYHPDLILVGGHNAAWNQFLHHVKDRLTDHGVKVPIKTSILGDEAVLIGAGSLWS